MSGFTLDSLHLSDKSDEDDSDYDESGSDSEKSELNEESTVRGVLAKQVHEARVARAVAEMNRDFSASLANGRASRTSGMSDLLGSDLFSSKHHKQERDFSLGSLTDYIRKSLPQVYLSNEQDDTSSAMYLRRARRSLEPRGRTLERKVSALLGDGSPKVLVSPNKSQLQTEIVSPDSVSTQISGSDDLLKRLAASLSTNTTKELLRSEKNTMDINKEKWGDVRKEKGKEKADYLERSLFLAKASNAEYSQLRENRRKRSRSSVD